MVTMMPGPQKLELCIRVEKFLDGETEGESTGGGIQLRVTRLDPSRQPLADPAEVRFVGVGARAATRIARSPGRFLVEAIAPSGEMVSETVELADESVDIALRFESSPHEWLSWQQIFGCARENRNSYERWLESGSQFSSAMLAGEVHLHVGLGPLDLSLDRGPLPLPGEMPPASGGSRLEASYLLRGDQLGPVSPIEHVDSFLVCNPRGRDVIGLLPRPWPGRLDRDQGSYAYHPCDIDVLVRISLPRSQLAKERVLDVRTLVRDQRAAAMLAYLAKGDSATARLMAREARHLLFEKLTNPRAAAGGAYALVDAMDAGGQWDHDKKWFDWIANLMDWNPWLPDGAILHSWVSLQRGHVSDAEQSLRIALARGVPLYSAGILCLHRLAKIFPEVAEDLRDEVRGVRYIARHADFSQPFTVFPAPWGRA